jgi:hypothetical protein
VSRRAALTALACILVFPSMPRAADAGERREYRGILYNERCLSARPDWLPFAAEHSRDCAMLPACFLSGYHLVVDEKTVFKLDRRGELLARRLLLKTRKQDDFRVVIRGRLEGRELMVQTLAEVP